MDHLTQRSPTQVFSSGLLTAAGAEAVYDTTVTVQFAINGVMGVALAAVTDGTAITTDIVTGDAFVAFGPSEASVFVWMLNLAGQVKVAQGSVVAVDESGNRAAGLEFPLVDGDTYAPFAYQVIAADSSASAFTFGTSNWNATGITDVIKNVSQLPSRPSTDATS